MVSDDDATPPGQVLIYKEGPAPVLVRLDGQTVWLTQKQMATLYQVTVQNISHHLAEIYDDAELTQEATIKQYLIVQPEGEREVKRLVEHYNLNAIIAVGYRVRSGIGIRFRQWATTQLRELLERGFVLDDRRIKAGRTIGHDYFDQLLERIREIRSSERIFYRKITDLYAESFDYDKNAEITKAFFKTVQNALHYAIHGHTAAEIIRSRADANKPNMGLTTWERAPHGRIAKADVSNAKNYLRQEELSALNRLVSMFLDYAEDQALKKTRMYMKDWATKLKSDA